MTYTNTRWTTDLSTAWAKREATAISEVQIDTMAVTRARGKLQEATQALQLTRGSVQAFTAEVDDAQQVIQVLAGNPKATPDDHKAALHTRKQARARCVEAVKAENAARVNAADVAMVLKALQANLSETATALTDVRREMRAERKAHPDGTPIKHRPRGLGKKTLLRQQLESFEPQPEPKTAQAGMPRRYRGPGKKNLPLPFQPHAQAYSNTLPLRNNVLAYDNQDQPKAPLVTNTTFKPPKRDPKHNDAEHQEAQDRWMAMITSFEEYPESDEDLQARKARYAVKEAAIEAGVMQARREAVVQAAADKVLAVQRWDQQQTEYEAEQARERERNKRIADKKERVAAEKTAERADVRKAAAAGVAHDKALEKAQDAADLAQIRVKRMTEQEPKVIREPQVQEPKTMQETKVIREPQVQEPKTMQEMYEEKVQAAKRHAQDNDNDNDDDDGVGKTMAERTAETMRKVMAHEAQRQAANVELIRVQRMAEAQEMEDRDIW